MMKRYTMSLAVALAGSVAFAQYMAETAAGASNTTAAENRAASPGAGAAPTSPSAAMAQAFTQDAFNKRWEMEEKMYRDAGIAEEKITKLKEINQKMWDARSKGQPEDFKELSRQRKEVLNAEEVQKLTTMRRQMIQQRLGTDKATTGSAAETQE